MGAILTAEMRRTIVIAGALALLVGGLAGAGRGAFRGQQTLAATKAGWLSIPADEIAPDGVRVFSYQDPAGRKLRFLLARDSHGRLYTVFDACEQCFKFHKGYTVSGHYLICGYCGNRYRLREISKGEGSCVPVRLSHSEAGHAVEVRVSDLERDRDLF